MNVSDKPAFFSHEAAWSAGAAGGAFRIGDCVLMLWIEYPSRQSAVDATVLILGAWLICTGGA
jgi:hypothetical protein